MEGAGPEEGDVQLTALNMAASCLVVARTGPELALAVSLAVLPLTNVHVALLPLEGAPAGEDPAGELALVGARH